MLNTYTTNNKTNNINCKVTMYENDKKYSFSQLSGNELNAIIEIIELKFNHNNCNISYDGDDNDYMILRNIDVNNMKKYMNKKILVNPQQFGVNPWGKVELYFELEDNN